MMKNLKRHQRMDELEFRRRVIAQPNNLDKEVLKFAANNPERLKFISDTKAFDKQLHNALTTPVPDNLAERILLNTSLQDKATTEEKVPKYKSAMFKFDRMHLALAASFLIAVGTFFLSSTHHSSIAAGEHALAHVYYEINALNKNDPISLQTVNDKLSLLGGHIDELPGKVTFATFCNFKGERGLHLVFESDFGPMTVFIVPSENRAFSLGDEHFQDARFEGQINRGTQADTILIASVGAPLSTYNKRVTGAIRWL